METCFAMKKNGCGALETGCPGFAECPFYKTRDQVDENRRKAEERISGLPLAMQFHISLKYCGGLMPWSGKVAHDVQES